MNADELVKMLGLFGKKRSDLVAMSVLPDEPLQQIFPGAETKYFKPENGITMTFSSDDEVFIKFFMILMEITPSRTEYKGELPEKMSKRMTQASVREHFGTPRDTHGALRMPLPMGWVGGWDIYNYDDDAYPGVELVVQYTADLEVHTIVFKKMP